MKSVLKRTRFYDVYILKTLKFIDSNRGITANARQQLNSLLCIISKLFSFGAAQLTILSERKTIGVAELEFFTETINLSSIDFGRQAVLNFETSKEKHLSRQTKSNLIFPPSVAERFLRETNCLITKTAPIFLVAQIQYICTELLKSAQLISDRLRLTIRDLELGLQENQELFSLCKSMNISFLGGGIKPFIHPELLLKKPPRKKKTPTLPVEIDPKKHRFRQGTVAIREIRKMQKTSDSLVLPKLPFERFTRKIVQGKIAKNVFIVLQHYIEQEIVNFLNKANKLALHANRVKLIRADLELTENIS